MRPVASKEKTPQRAVSPQIARRRELRRRSRQARLIQLWRLFVLLILSSGMGWILLRHGWTVESANQLLVSGDAGVDSARVAQAAELNFPVPLLEVSPRELELKLLQTLPVRTAQVRRHMLPARLEVTLTLQKPIARAERQQPTGRERGLVDAQGRWIPISDVSPKPATRITVKGWSIERRPQIAELLRQRDRFNGTLRTVILQPDGAISLITTGLGRIDLGRDTSLMTTQIDAIAQLNQSMPAHLLKDSKGRLDLSNPERPELQLPVKKSPPGSSTWPASTN